MSPLNIGLEAWIIQDGNYGDFEVGGNYRFALEFHPHDLRAIDTPARQPPDLRLIEGADYESDGVIVRVASRSWVVDFGVLAFQESRPPKWANRRAPCGRPSFIRRGPVHECMEGRRRSRTLRPRVRRAAQNLTVL